MFRKNSKALAEEMEPAFRAALIEAQMGWPENLTGLCLTAYNEHRLDAYAAIKNCVHDVSNIRWNGKEDYFVLPANGRAVEWREGVTISKVNCYDPKYRHPEKAESKKSPLTKAAGDKRIKRNIVQVLNLAKEAKDKELIARYTKVITCLAWMDAE